MNIYYYAVDIIYCLLISNSIVRFISLLKYKTIMIQLICEKIKYISKSV